MMTKKDFEMLALVIRRNPHNERNFLFDFCILAKKNNVRFDKEKFLLECGYL